MTRQLTCKYITFPARIICVLLGNRLQTQIDTPLTSILIFDRNCQKMSLHRFGREQNESEGTFKTSEEWLVEQLKMGLLATRKLELRFSRPTLLHLGITLWRGLPKGTAWGGIFRLCNNLVAGCSGATFKWEVGQGGCASQILFSSTFDPNLLSGNETVNTKTNERKRGRVGFFKISPHSLSEKHSKLSHRKYIRHTMHTLTLVLMWTRFTTAFLGKLVPIRRKSWHQAS